MKLFTSEAQRPVSIAVLYAIGVVVLSLILLVGCPQLFAQGNAGRVLGSVTDQTGGAIVGATVTILDTQRNITRTVMTDAAGEYNAPNLLPGMYTVGAAYQGFKTAQRSGITLEVNQELRVDLTLQPGEQTEKVTVTGELPLVETTNSVVGGTIQNNVINDLPLNGRNFTNLLVLRPGTVKYAGGSGWTQSTNGLRPHDQNYMVDGINSNDPWMAQSVMNAVMAAGDAGTMLPIDAIDEFRTEQNPQAEYGWKPGGVINVGIKSGSNSIHGTAYAYGRDNAWDARDFFNPAPVNGVCTTIGGAVQALVSSCNQAPLNLEQFGVSVGGPIVKNKLFYFANFEQQQYTDGNPQDHFVPVTSGAGALAPTNGLIGACLAAFPANGGTGLAPLSAQMAGLSTSCTPLGNFPGLFPSATSANFLTDLDTTNTIHSGVAKIDYHMSDRNSFSGSYFISPGSGIFVDSPTTEIANQWLTNQYARSQVVSGGWTFTPSSAWVNDFRVGYSHYYQTFLSNDYAQNPAAYTYNGAVYNIYTGQTDVGSAGSPAFGGLPEISMKQFSGMTFGLNWPKYVGPDGVLNIVDHISYLRGNHSFVFGGEVVNNRSTNAVTQYAKGRIQFASLDDFFTGSVLNGDFASGNFADWQRKLYDSGYALFAQDTWRLKPRLTLNLGLRYEIDTVMQDRNNQLGNFNPNVGLVQVGTNGLNSPYNGDHNNFAPRLGLAWDIQGNGKTVLRASGDIMYEQFSFDTLNGIGNLLGLRTIPTGATLAYTNPVTGLPVTTQGSGSIDIGAIAYSGAAAAALSGNWLANSSATPLFFGSATCGDGTVTLPNGITPQPCSIVSVAQNLRTPYVGMWTLDLQRAITANLSLDVAYVGNHGAKLLGMLDLNQPPVGAGWGLASNPASPLAGCIAAPGPGTCQPSGALEAAAEPFASKFPYLGYIDQMSNLGKSNYNALQVTLTQRTSHGLSFIAGYTHSHALDMSSDNWGAGLVQPINNANVGNLYGNNVFDIPNNFTFSATYALPGRKGAAQMLEGWSLNSVVTLQSGEPWGVNDETTDFSGTGEIFNASGSTEGEWWNFYGNPKDFASSTAFLNTNVVNGVAVGGIPYYPGSCPRDAPLCLRPPPRPPTPRVIARLLPKARRPSPRSAFWAVTPTAVLFSFRQPSARWAIPAATLSADSPSTNGICP